MNKDIIGGKWAQLKGRVQARWGELTDNDLDIAEGNAETLVGLLQERYGWAREAAVEQVREFEKTL